MASHDTSLDIPGTRPLEQVLLVRMTEPVDVPSVQADVGKKDIFMTTPLAHARPELLMISIWNGLLTFMAFLAMVQRPSCEPDPEREAVPEQLVEPE